VTTPPEQDEEEPIQSTSKAEKRKKSAKGITSLADDPSYRKYGNNLPKNLATAVLDFVKTDPFFAPKPDLCAEAVALVAGSLAKRTWNKYSSALAQWEHFCKNTQGGNSLPYTDSTKMLFICWCSKRTSLAPSTIKAYLSALDKISLLTKKTTGGGGGEGKLVLKKLILRGMENLRGERGKTETPTNPVTLTLLDQIRRGLKRDSCTRCTRKAIWALALSSYWGLFRLGEILPKHVETFDKTTDLLWENVMLSKNKVVFTLKFPKVRNDLSRTVVLYKISDQRYCPVKAMTLLKENLQEKGLWDLKKPVFVRNSGKALTKTSFLEGLNRLLRASKGGGEFLTGKSFRSGIPTELGEFPEELSAGKLKVMGRWKGPSFLRYIRNPEPQNRWIYKEVSEFLLKNFLRRH
jgi:hypothetical protein